MGEVGDIISHAEFGMGKNNVISSLMMEQEKSNFEGVDEAGKCHDIWYSPPTQADCNSDGFYKST